MPRPASRLPPPTTVLGLLLSAVRDTSGFGAGLNEVSVITSNAPNTNALGRYRMRMATQTKMSVSPRALRKSGEVRGAAAWAMRGPRATTVSFARTTGGGTVAAIVGAEKPAPGPWGTAVPSVRGA